MKNFKKVLALTLALAVIMSSMTVAFAASANDAKAKVLYDLGLFKGTSTTEYVPALDAESNAQQALVLIGRSLKWEVNLAATTTFTDVAEYAVPYVAYAVEKGITNGVSATEFGVDNFDGKRMVTWFLRALGYNMADAWTKNAELAATAGLTVPTATTRDAVVGVIYEGLMATPVAAGSKTLIETVVGSDATLLAIAQEASLIAKNLEVVSVTATNNLEIVVTFNNEVDKTTAETDANYTLSAGTVADSVKDGKTVTITLAAAAAQQASVDVTIKNVKDINGKVVADTTKSVKFFDSVVPAVKSVEVTGPKTLKVTFSEPITSSAITTTSNFVVDNNTYSIASVAASGNNAVIVTLGATLPAGDHTVTVNNGTANTDPSIKDMAGFYVVKNVSTFTYTVDSVVPTVVVSSAKQNEVKLTFSKDIDAATQANLEVYHTYSGNASYKGTNTWTSNKEVTVAFASAYLPVGTANIFVNNVSSTSQLKDNWGNVYANTALTAAITSDAVAPTVTLVEAKSATSIEVTYSEAVTGATTAANYTLKDSSNATVSVTSAVLKSGNIYTLTTATMNGGSYTLAIANIKDTSVSTNAMAAYTTTVVVNDLIKPTVTATGVFSTDQKKIVVKFSEAMAVAGVNSIVEKANYQISLDGGTNWTDLKDITGATIAAGSGNKSVIITYPSTQATLTAGDKVKVARVADVAGNMTAAFTTDVTLAADDVILANVTDTEKATLATSISFDIDTTLSAIDVTKFSLDTAAKAAVTATYVNGDNKATVTVTVSDANKFATDLSDLTNVQILAGGVTTSLGTSNSGTITILKANITDNVAPAVVSTETGDADADGHLDKVVVTYSEALYIASVADADYTVEGYEVTGVTVAGAVVTIAIKELASFDTAATPKVTLVGAVSDNSAARNSLGNQAAVTSTDKAAPVLLSVEQTAAATATITVSEPVYHVALTVTTDITGTVNTAASEITAVTSAQVLSANAVNTILLTAVDPVNVTTETVTYTVNGVGAAKILDAAGNAAATATLTDANGF